MITFENELTALQQGYTLEEKVLLRIGWEQALKLVEVKLNSSLTPANTQIMPCQNHVYGDNGVCRCGQLFIL